MARSIASQETETVDRHAVAAALREIARLLAAERDNRFRARAYERAARAVESLENLEALVRAGRLTDVPGMVISPWMMPTFKPWPMELGFEPT